MEAITAKLEERDPRAWAVMARPYGAATQAQGRDRARRTRVAAVAGLFLLAAGAGAFVLVAHTGGGPGDSVGRSGAVEGGQHGAALEAEIRRGPAQPSRGSGQSVSSPGHPQAQGDARRKSHGAGESAPVAAETIPPAPEPAAAAPAIAAPPAPSSSQPSSTSTQAKGADGAGAAHPSSATSASREESRLSERAPDCDQRRGPLRRARLAGGRNRVCSPGGGRVI